MFDDSGSVFSVGAPIGDVGAPSVVDDVMCAPDGTGVHTDGMVTTPPCPTRSIVGDASPTHVRWCGYVTYVAHVLLLGHILVPVPVHDTICIMYGYMCPFLKFQNLTIFRPSTRTRLCAT